MSTSGFVALKSDKTLSLKLVSVIFYQIFIFFNQMIALQKL